MKKKRADSPWVTKINTSLETECELNYNLSAVGHCRPRVWKLVQIFQIFAYSNVVIVKFKMWEQGIVEVIYATNFILCVWIWKTCQKSIIVNSNFRLTPWGFQTSPYYKSPKPKFTLMFTKLKLPTNQIWQHRDNIFFKSPIYMFVR